MINEKEYDEDKKLKLEEDVLDFLEHLKSVETEYKNVYEFKDTTWFIIDRQSNEYVFQPCELGDWDYELKNEEELKKIMATYFINKYDIEEHRAIQEVENILKEIK